MNKWPKGAWTRAYFKKSCKGDNIVNDTCEVFDVKILNYRGKPILTMDGAIICYMMRTISSKLNLVGRNKVRRIVG